MAYFTTQNVLGQPQAPVALTAADWAKFLGRDGTTVPMPMMYPGQKLEAYDPAYGWAEFVLAYGVAGLQVGDAVRIGGGYATTRAVAGSRGTVGISMAANTDPAALSWFCVRGQVPARVAAATAINLPLNLTATAGSLSGTNVAGDTLVGATSATAQGATVRTSTLNTVNASTELLVTDLTGLYVGMAVSGTGIASSSVITAIGYGGNMLGTQGPRANIVQLNNAMTATGQAAITFAHPAGFLTAHLQYPVAPGAV